MYSRFVLSNRSHTTDTRVGQKMTSESEFLREKLNFISIIDYIKLGWKMTGSLSSVGTIIIYPSTHCTVSNCFLSCPRGFTGLQFSQVNSHTIQPPQVVGVAMDTVASYPLSFNHSVRYVQDHLVLIG